MTDPDADPSAAARAAFLEVYKADLAAQRIRTLAEYQAQFAGHEESIADEWRWLEPATLGDVHPRAPAQQNIGDYRILEELGHGAQATVYLAEHETLRRQVALKVLRAPLTDGTSRSEQRFRREAEVTASIEHPNICSVYEAGTSDGATWIAMQYVPGSTLATHLINSDGVARDSTVQLPGDASSDDGSATASTGAAGRSDLMRVVAFAEQAARALHVAHERGLVHRDIKPGNLMVTESGTPVVLDFGLARSADRDGSVDGLGLTRTNDVLGTPYYMAPEQLRSDIGAVDRRVDVYALGVTLFECLTRQRPFVGVSVEALYQQILTVDPPAPRSINPAIPRDLEVVLLTAIEKDRNRRYQTALDLAEDLRRVRQYEPIRARPISGLGRVVRLARRHPGVAASLTLAVVSLVAGLVVSLLFLSEANQALTAKDEALTNWYDDVSVRAALDNMEGSLTAMQAKLRDRAVEQINLERSGFGNVVARDVGMVSGGHPGYPLDALARLLEKAKTLSLVGRCAVADLLVPVLRQKMDEAQWEPRRPRAGPAITLARRQLELLDELPSTDVRKIRTRILLLDGLNQNHGRSAQKQYAEEAKRLVLEWLEADLPLRGDPARRALYQSRLGASMFALGESEAAYRLFETDGVVTTVVNAFPNTWYANVAIASLVEVLDQTGEPSEVSRRSLAQSLRGSLVHRNHGHLSAYAIRVLVGDSHRWLLDRLVRVYWSTSMLGSRPDFDGLLRKLGPPGDLDEVSAGLCVYLATEIANNLGMSRADYSDPDVGRLTSLALRSIESLSDWHPSIRVSVYQRHGKYLATSGRYEEATEMLDRAVHVSEFDDQWKPEWRLGSYLSHRGDYERAENLLQRALVEARSWHGPAGPPSIQTRQALARLYRKQGKLAAAVAWHREGIEHRPRKPAEHRMLGITYLQFGKWEEAEQAFRATLQLDPNDIGARRRLAHLSLLRGKHAKAIAQAEAARALGRKLAAEKAAKAAAAKRGGKRPRPPRPRPIALARQAMLGLDRVQAMALLASGNAIGALPFFTSAATAPVRVDGDGFWSDYGAALVAAGRGKDARELLQDLVTKRPQDALAWHARARFLAEIAKPSDADRAEAVACAAKANELCRNGRAFVLAMLARAQFQNGDAPSARKTAAAVATLMTGDAQWLSVEQFAKQRAKY